jgi:serine/threonine protein phosphatase PrpC
MDIKQLNVTQSSSLSAQSCGKTDKGLIRFVNEDAFLELTKEKLWLVADGMGGHKRGDYASKAIVKAFSGFTPKNTLTKLIEDIQNRLADANETCQKAFRAKRVGSTVALLFEFGGYCFCLWAGDSRIYRLRENKLQLLTRDHSLFQEKLDKGELEQEAANNHPSAHILTRAVGINQHLKLELQYSPAQVGDRYLLCSDGLYGDIAFEEIHSLLSQSKSAQALESLINRALEAGGKDNITAIVVDIA